MLYQFGTWLLIFYVAGLIASIAVAAIDIYLQNSKEQRRRAISMLHTMLIETREVIDAGRVLRLKYHFPTIHLPNNAGILQCERVSVEGVARQSVHLRLADRPLVILEYENFGLVSIELWGVAWVKRDNVPIADAMIANRLLRDIDALEKRALSPA